MDLNWGDRGAGRETNTKSLLLEDGDSGVRAQGIGCATNAVRAPPVPAALHPLHCSLLTVVQRWAVLQVGTESVRATFRNGVNGAGLPLPLWKVGASAGHPRQLTGASILATATGQHFVCADLLLPHVGRAEVLRG